MARSMRRATTNVDVRRATSLVILLSERSEDIRVLPRFRNPLLLHVGDLAVLVDDDGRARGESFVVEIEPVLRRDRALRMKIREQRKVEAELLLESGLRPRAVDADAEHLRVRAVELREVLL